MLKEYDTHSLPKVERNCRYYIYNSSDSNITTVWSEKAEDILRHSELIVNCCICIRYVLFMCTFHF